MDARTLRILEFDKIRERVAHFTAFSLGGERARSLSPTDDIRLAQTWQAETSEARDLLGLKSDIFIGGVRDLRPLTEQALRGGLILPAELQDVRYTLNRSRSLQRMLSRLANQFPHVGDVGERLVAPKQIIDEIGRCIDARGEVLDSASDALGRIRRAMRQAHSRVQERLQRIVSSSANAPYLQETLVTQRGGRYVIPLRAEFKGRIPGLVHDQSSSGATLFVEPMAVVELNNQWREAQLAEEEEIRRILAALSGLIAADAEAIDATVEALGDLDLILAKARYANELLAVTPELLPWPKRKDAARDRRRPGKQSHAQATPDGKAPISDDHPGSVIQCFQARHPLLDEETVVPIDIHLEDDYFVVVITGPNTGGKTVSLKTTGLLAVMAQSGLAIPASEGARLTVFEQIFADIGDEQSIEQSLSTFSSHMTHIVGILDRVDSRSLVLLDELGAGTDPEEGAGLAQALLKTLLARRITTFATTHYSELKIFAHTTPFVANASVEFDIETLSPTYRLNIGLPGQSNAFAIARRLGLPREIVSQAEALVSPQSMETEAMLTEINRSREAARLAEAEAETLQRQAQALQADLNYRLGQIEAARREVLAQTRAEAEAELAGIQEEIAQIRSRIARADGDGIGRDARSVHEQWLAEAEAVLAERTRLAAAPPSLSEPAPLVIDGPLEVGDKVWVPSLQGSGEIVAVVEREVEVRVGSFRIKLAAQRVQLQQRNESPAVQAAGVIPASPSPGMELDLRGMTVDDMLVELDHYLDSAYLAGLPTVRLIHGKGTGALRQAVRDELRGHPLVGEFRLGESGEGGDGVTVAKLVQR